VCAPATLQAVSLQEFDMRSRKVLNRKVNAYLPLVMLREHNTKGNCGFVQAHI